MKINKIMMSNKASRVVFTGVRTDKNCIEQLKTGEKPIIENNKLNIYAALNNMSARTDRESIQFLLDVADNLVYGQGGANSRFKEYLDEEGYTSDNRENTDWSFLLQEAIKKALSFSKGDNEDLKAEYKRIFGSEKELTPWQEKLIELNSTLINEIISGSTLDYNDIISQISEFEIEKMLNYFLASSEISAKQKQECLEKFITFMSNDYKIDPQLQDKKLQILSEMLNDMLIKTPESEILTTKSVDQRQSGYCGAISICRKALAYEDKSLYVDLIMEELKDSDVMSVFDVTELGSGKKVNIPKTKIDYISGLKKGYRIIDMSAHNWMQNAHASGDGSLVTEDYYAPSDEFYGIYDDSSWYLGLNDKASEKKPLLMAVIKEKEFIESYRRNKKAIQEAEQNISTVKKEALKLQTASLGCLNSIFTEIFPDKSLQDISSLIKDILKFYQNKDSSNESAVPDKLSKNLKSKIIVDYITARIPDISDEQNKKLKDNAQRIYDMLNSYTDAEKQIKNLKRFNSPKSKYILNEKLFKIAAAHRIAVEADLNLPDGPARYEKFMGLPPREIQILDFFNKLYPTLSPDKQIELSKDIFQIESVIPQELDNILKTVVGKTLLEMLTEFYDTLIKNVEQNNKSTIEDIKKQGTFGLEKDIILKNLKKVRDKFTKTASKTDVGEAIRLLGLNDKFHFIVTNYNAFIKAMSKGISETEYKKLVQRMGGKDKIEATVNSMGKRLDELEDSYIAILDKWNVPSAEMLILKKMEQSKFVLSPGKLKKLKSHFDDITEQRVKNESISDLKKRAEANENLYKFSDEEKEIFESVEKRLSNLRKYAKLSYNSLCKLLYEDLGKQYSNIGMLNGQFWVREEGSSGLAVTEQIRIYEQMTGRPYHAENDIEKAAEEIKKGQGSGIISLSVEDDDYGFHALYVPGVTEEIFVNPFNKVKLYDDVIWMDNSWGCCEKEHYWNGRDGYLYTDYNSGYGWKNGFILAPNTTIGLKVNDISGAVGYAKRDNNDIFELFSDIILPNEPKNTYYKLFKMFESIFSINKGEEIFNQLEKNLVSGKKISIKYLNGLDDLADDTISRLDKRLETIKSKEDFDKLPPDDELRLIFDKLAVYMYLRINMPRRKQEVLSVNSEEELNYFKEDLKSDILENYASIIGKSQYTVDNIYMLALDDISDLAKDISKEFGVNISDKRLEYILKGIFNKNVNIEGTLDDLQLSLLKNVSTSASKHIKNPQALSYFVEKAESIIKKVIDENIRIKSLNTMILQKNPGKDDFIAVIDKYLTPESDEELLILMQQMQNVNYDRLESIFSAITYEDAGLIFKDPYEYVKLYKADNVDVTKAFSHIVNSQVVDWGLKGCDEKSPEDLYRDLYCKLSYLDVQKYVKSYKAEAFQKYKVRQAFPQPVVIPENEFVNTANNMLKSIEYYVMEIENNKLFIKVLSSYENILQNYADKKFFKSLKQLQDVKIDDTNADTINKFIADIQELYSLTQADDIYKTLNKVLLKLIESLNTDSGIIDGKKAGTALKKVISEFKRHNSPRLNLDDYIQLNKEKIKEFKLLMRYFVKANIDPQYRDEVMAQLNKYALLLIDNNDPENINLEAEKFIDLMINRHIIKNPQALLKECVEMLMAGQKDDEVYKTLKGYLINALRVAQQTNLQYKLVENQHACVSSKLKDMLSRFDITLKNGKRELMSNDAGLLFLVQQLQNTGDNNVILNLFLNQTGLNSKVLKALINNVDIAKSRKLVDDTYKEIQQMLKDLEGLSDCTLDFFKQAKIKCPSLKETVEQLVNYVERQYKSDIKNNKIVSKYISYMKSLDFNNVINKTSPSEYLSITGALNVEALNVLALEIKSKIDFINYIKEVMCDRADIIEGIEIEPDSEDEKTKKDFLSVFDTHIEYIDKVEKRIFDDISKFNYITTEKK